MSACVRVCVYMCGGVHAYVCVCVRVFMKSGYTSGGFN